MIGGTPVDFNKGAEFKNTKWLEKLQWILKGRSLKTLNDWRNSSGF